MNGTYEPKYAPIVDALQRSLTVGWDLGASMFVAINGTTVIDVAGGYKDKAKTKVYDTSTINLVFSCGKIMEAMSMAILEDKGLLNIDNPIAKYWPEYGQNGKDEITIKDLLTHRSGSTFNFNTEPSLDILQSHEKRDAFIAAQTYLYPRGTVAYRMMSSAFVSDAICRRVDPQKRTLASFIMEEVFDQLGGGDREGKGKEAFLSPPILGRGEEYESNFSEVHDVWTSTMMLGILPQVLLPGIYSKVLPDGHYSKLYDRDLAHLKPAVTKQKYEDGFSHFDLPTLPDTDLGAASWNNHSSYLSYEMMSANSISNARALAKALDAFMAGKVVREVTLEKFLKPLPEAYDRLLTTNITYATGGWTVGNSDLFPIHEDCNGWFGYGGSTIMHCKIGGIHNVTFSYVENLLAPALRLDRAIAVLRKLIA